MFGAGLGELGAGASFLDPFSMAAGMGGAGVEGFALGGGALSGLGGAAVGGLGGSLNGLGSLAGAAGGGGIDWGGLLRSGLSNPAALGGLLGAGMGALGGGNQTITQRTELDPQQRAFLSAAQQRALSVADQPFQGYGGALSQGPTAEQQQAAGTAGDFAAGNRNGTAAVNPLFGLDNPELTRQIDFATQDLARGYNNVVAPKFASGSSFGNSGLGFMELDARNDLARNMGRIGSDMRFANYGLQAQLGESAAGRQDAMTTGNLGRQLSGAGLLGSLGGQMWGQNQQGLENNYAEFLRGQNWGMNQLQALNGPLQQTSAGASQSQTIPGNRWASALGGGLLGAQVGGMFGGQKRAPATAGSMFG